MIKIFIKLILFVDIFFLVTSARAEVDFGVLIPLTGNAADQGEWERKGFELAKEEINFVGKYKINLIYEDVSGADAKTGVQAYKSLMFKKKVPVVFSYGSGVGMALTPLVNQDRVVQMGVATGTPSYSSEGDYTFRNFPSASLEAEFNVRVLKEHLKLNDIAILQVDNAYGEGYKKAFLEKFKGKIVFQQTYDPQETDFRTLILKVKNSGAKLLYLIAYTNDGALILKQLKQLSYILPVLGTGGIAGGENFFKLVGDSAEGLYVFGTKFDETHPFLKAYNEKYKVIFNNPAQVIYAARAYDALKIVVSTLDRCPNAQATCIKDELYKIKDYPSVCGNISFDKNGDINSDFAAYQIQGREFVTINQNIINNKREENMDNKNSNQANPSCSLPPDDAELRKLLSPEQYKVVRQNGTEAPFKNAFWDNHQAGIYVDIVSGEPLFSSLDKFDSGTGWPSFTQPLNKEALIEKNDSSLLMNRVEVRSQKADSHLGHVFNDGPAENGLRYCINSAALRFIAVEELDKQGYGQYKKLFQ